MSRQVEEMFSDIAPRYDRANRILSFGVDRRWRRAAVRLSGARPGDRVLDLATGTGDLAFRFARAVGPQGEVTGVDLVQAMLDVAERKRAKSGLPVRFLRADALALPFPDGGPEAGFDVASIAFGIRNVDDPARGVAEMARVVRTGGRVVVLEFGQPTGLWGRAYRLYARRVMPRLGALVTGNRAAYEYLPETAARFPAGERFLDLMRGAATFSGLRSRRLTGGIAWVYVGTVA